MRVLYFGCYDREGGRNAIVQAALRAMALVFVDAGAQDEYGLQLGARRLVDALRTGGAAACPAHEVAAASDSARGQPGAHPAHPPAAEMASMR